MTILDCFTSLLKERTVFSTVIVLDETIYGLTNVLISIRQYYYCISNCVFSTFLSRYKLPTTNRFFNVLILSSEYDFNNEKNHIEDFKFINRPYSGKSENSENSDGRSRRSSRRTIYDDDDDEVHYTSGVSKKKNKFETVFDRVRFCQNFCQQFFQQFCQAIFQSNILNKSCDSYFEAKRRAKQSPITARANFFQNTINEKATGKNEEYYQKMADAMEKKRVYELFGVRADFYRPAMEKRGYFQREKANLKLAKIKVLGRSKVDTNVIACESRNKVIREFRHDLVILPTT